MKALGMLGLMICVTATSAASAQQPPVAGPSHPGTGLTGFWALRFDSRNVPSAVLLDSVTPDQIAARRLADEHVIRWCQPVGTPYQMQSSAPIDIVEGKTQIVITSETISAGRHIYLDRSSPPDADSLDPTANGFSIGHWDGQTLLVHTTAFSDRGYTALPGGGFRSATSDLTERYRLVEGGHELEVTFTWTDPKVFREPHTYAFRYHRMPRGYNAGESFCDPNDQERGSFLTHPPEPARLSQP